MRGLIECPCGCGMPIREETRKMGEAIQRMAGFEIYITSGARCENYNRLKGFNENSAHTLGLALDIATPTSNARSLILAAIYALGIRRIGRKNSDNPASRFVHFDLAANMPVPHPRAGLTHYPTDVDWDY